MTIRTERTTAYGMWKASGFREDGALVEAMGLTAYAAERFATVRAREWERCAGCSRANVPPAEAKVSRRALGCVLCAECRSRSEGPDPDYEREAAAGL